MFCQEKNSPFWNFRFHRPSGGRKARVWVGPKINVGRGNDSESAWRPILDRETPEGKEGVLLTRPGCPDGYPRRSVSDGGLGCGRPGRTVRFPIRPSPRRCRSPSVPRAADGYRRASFSSVVCFFMFSSVPSEGSGVVDKGSAASPQSSGGDPASTDPRGG